MTSSIQPTIRPTDRVTPQRAAKPRPAPTRRPWFAATILSVGTLVLVGGGFGAYQMLTTGELPKPRMAAIKLGPLPEMPDLRDGVPALLPARKAAAAAQPATNAMPIPATAPQPTTAEAQDANRKAMASTVAAANLRPALAASPAPSVRAEADTPKPAVAPVSASASIVAGDPAPVRQVEMKRPTETASIVDAKAPVSAPVPAVAPTPAPVAAVPAAQPRPVEAASAPRPHVASLPADAPLPPRKPALQAPEPSQDRAPERASTAKPRPVAMQPRPASPAPAPQTVASAQEVRAPARAVEEDRSILGVPVPRFVPTGRDIRDAAATVGNAITSIPDHF